MNKKLIALIMGVIFPISSFAMSLDKVNQIYKHLINSNYIKNAPTLMVVQDNTINAGNGNGIITINTGTLQASHNDTNKIAFVLGHELAHFKLHHRSSNYANEYAADTLGAILESSAGYNRCDGVKMLLKLPKGASNDHPDSIDRYNRVKCK